LSYLAWQSKPLFATLEEELVEQVKAGDISVIFFLFETNAGLSLLNNARIRKAITSDALNGAVLSDSPHIFQSSSIPFANENAKFAAIN
jgi:hypothetical protein